MDNLRVDFRVFEFPVESKLRKLIDEPVNEDLIKKNKYANNSAYIPESVYRRILNKVTNYQWSFVPHSIEVKGEGDKAFVEYIGLLIVPGFGIHTGIGTQGLKKKDNANATAAAKTYAFKNACKEMGIAPNIGDEDFEEPVFENVDDEEIDFSEEEPKKERSKEQKKEGSKEPKKEEKKKTGKKAGKKLTLDERIDEVREAYELEKDDDLVAFIQIWDEDILEVEDMDEDDWEEFLEYLEENKDEFEDF